MKLGLWLLAGALAIEAAALQPDPAKLLTKVAFGSCNLQLLPQSYWSTIAKEAPDLWIWGGDNIYADYHTPSMRKLQWDLQYHAAAYARFRQSFPVIGTWDDHDYGDNNTGKAYPHKQKTQRLLLDFLDEPAESPRRKQEGVYTSYLLGPEGKRVRIVLLDLRYFRDDPGTNADILGKAQWDWLESELAKRDAAFTLIVSSSQLLPENPGEKWADYPASKERMIRLLQALGAQVAVLSGDLHMGQLSSHSLGGGVEVYELLSSGLTHGHLAEEAADEPESMTYKKRNFAIVGFEWGERSVRVNLTLKKISGQTAFERSIDVSF